MKIGIDYGGVVDHNPKGWEESIKKAISNGYEIYIVSHAHPGQDHERRTELAEKTGAIDHTFSDTMDENVIMKRKAEIVKSLNLDLFIDDYMNRCNAVRDMNPYCGVLSIENTKQSLTKLIFDRITGVSTNKAI